MNLMYMEAPIQVKSLLMGKKLLTGCDVNKQEEKLKARKVQVAKIRSWRSLSKGKR